MQISKINAIQNSRFTVQPAFKKSQVIDDGDYVKIPKDKYKRDQILGWIVGAWLFFDLIHSFMEDDKVTKELEKMLAKIRKK